MKELKQTAIYSLLALGTVVLVCLLVVIWFIYSQAYDVINKELDRRITASADSILERIGSDLTFDKADVHAAMVSLRKNNDLSQLSLFDSNRISLADSNPSINASSRWRYSRLELPRDVANEVLAGKNYRNNSYKLIRLEATPGLVDDLPPPPPQPPVRAFGYTITDTNNMVIGGLVGLAEPEFEEPLRKTFRTFLIAALLTLGIFALFFGILASLLRRYARIQKGIEQRSRIDFIHMLSTGIMHEIKTPLATIDGSGQILSARLEHEEENAELANYIVTEAGRIKEIIDHSLGAGKATELRVIAVQPVIQHVVRLLSIAARRKRITVSCDMDTSAHVNTSVLMLRLIFSNIIGNAIQIVEDDTGEVVITHLIKPDRIGIRIQDNGPGISRGMLKKLFEPMASEREGGSGFGLAVAHQTVREMKGRIEMETKIGQGTAFTIWLPTVRSPAVSEVPGVLKS